MNVYLEELECGTFIDDGVAGVQGGYLMSSNCSQPSPVSPLSSSDDGSPSVRPSGPNAARSWSGLAERGAALGMHQVSAAQTSSDSAIRLNLLLR
jgi:hypothetical protein